MSASCKVLYWICCCVYSCRFLTYGNLYKYFFFLYIFLSKTKATKFTRFFTQFYFASVISNYNGELKRKDMYNKVKALDNTTAEPDKPPRGIAVDL